MTNLKPSWLQDADVESNPINEEMINCPVMESSIENDIPYSSGSSLSSSENTSLSSSKQRPNLAYISPIAPRSINIKTNNTQPSWLDETTPIKPSTVSATKSGETLTRPARLTFNDEDCCCCPSDPVLYWFRLLHFLTGSTSFITFFTNAILASYGPKLGWHSRVIHVYASIFSLIVISLELGIQVIRERLELLHFWVFRGLFYSFCGVLMLESEDSSWLTFIHNISSLALILFGIFFFIMGLCRFQSSIARRRAAQRQRVEYSTIADDFSISPFKF